jgi:hypothetical protein
MNDKSIRQFAVSIALIVFAIVRESLIKSSAEGAALIR